jgi:hypothetical protein
MSLLHDASSVFSIGRLRAAASLFPAALLLAGMSGCGTSPTPTVYEVSGSVTFAGKPIPAGRVVFEPDTERGASGMVSIANITDGQYATRPRRGFGGGPCRVTIYGSDGSLPAENPADHDNALFPPWQTTIDLPQASCQRDFAVPGETGSQATRPR